LGERRELEVLLASAKDSETNKKESQNSENKRESVPPRCAGESYFEEGRKTERNTERWRARKSEIKTKEYARKRKGQRV